MTELAPPTVPPPPRSLPRVLRAAVRLIKRAPTFPLRYWRMQSLRAAYRRGSANAARVLPDEDPDPAIVEAGTTLRQRLLTAYKNKFLRSSYRVLMFRPRSITAEIWFEGLRAGMRHAGIDCRVLPPDFGAAEINACFEAFQPNVFVATDSIAALCALDLPFIHGYKRHHGCLRLFIPVWHAGMAGTGTATRSTSRIDEWRWSLRRNGLTADAYFSIFEREFYEQSSRDKAGPDIDYVTVPQACNPFTDRPLPERKHYDYFMATSLTDERLEATCRFLRPILGRYGGLWAGRHWGFGQEYVPPTEMPFHYARTRVALSPLAGFVPAFGAELTHRVYAAAGCGTFQLTVPTAITSRYFRPDELVQAGSPEEYVRLFDHYVDRPAERNAIALRSLRRAYAEHTCFHRVDTLVSHWDDWRRRGLF